MIPGDCKAIEENRQKVSPVDRGKPSKAGKGEVYPIMRLENKVTIVTGGGKGIGAAICAAFSMEGARVVVADIDRAAAKEVAQSLQQAGRSASFVELDVTDAKSAAEMAQSVLKEYGQIDVLVNNAGARIIKGLMQHSQDDWEQMIRINLTGPFLCAQAVLPDMVERGSGKIINLASIASFMGRPNRCAYVAAKTGVLGLTRAMAAAVPAGPDPITATFFPESAWTSGRTIWLSSTSSAR